MIEDNSPTKMTRDHLGFSGHSRRDRHKREVTERVSRGEYWVDLDFLAGLLVDSRALSALGCKESGF